MALHLVFLGRLEDVAGADLIEVPAVPSIAALIAGLEADVARAVNDERIRIAVNGKLVADRSLFTLRDGDEIAFLPPVSGG